MQWNDSNQIFIYLLYFYLSYVVKVKSNKLIGQLLNRANTLAGLHKALWAAISQKSKNLQRAALGDHKLLKHTTTNQEGVEANI